MNPFKVGDRVRQIKSGWSTSPNDNGKESVIIKIDGDDIEIDNTGFDYKVGCKRNYRGFELTSANNIKNNNMNLKEKFITAFLSEPEKSFRKAGVTNGDGLLTEDGQKIFLSYLLKKEGATFKTEFVDKLLEEEK